jgi:hypothetical protein
MVSGELVTPPLLSLSARTCGEDRRTRFVGFLASCALPLYC